MPTNSRTFAACVSVVFVLACSFVQAEFNDDFNTADPERWEDPSDQTGWQFSDGLLRRTGQGDTLFRARVEPIADIVVETRLRLLDGPRQVFGIALRVDGDSYLLVRYYDEPQALELLTYRDGQWSRTGIQSEKVPIAKGTWYQLKVAAVGNRVLAKIWSEGDEPDWQLDAQVDNEKPGGFALVSHDNTQLEFDSVRATSDEQWIVELQAAVARERAERERAHIGSLQLAVSTNPLPTAGVEGPVRQVCVVPFAENDRFPVDGRLSIQCGDYRFEQVVTMADYEQQALWLEIPEPREATALRVTLATNHGKELQAESRIEPGALRPWREYVQICLDTLIEHGRDDYGEIKSPLFMTLVDADTLRSPSEPMQLDALVRLEDRMHRRGERGSNLWYDQSLLKCLYRMGDLSGDKRYAAAADDYIDYFFDHCYKLVDDKQVYLNGMPTWGTHVYWDCYKDQPAGDGDGNGPHEILVYRAEWEAMHKRRPVAVKREVDGIWRYHIVNKSTGLHNRHDDGNSGCDFAFSGSSFASAMAFMNKVSGQRRYLEQAKTIVDWHWLNRNQSTGLTADSPGLENRYDGHHCFTTVVGPHAHALLGCYQSTGDPHFRNVAIAYIKAFDRYGWDEERQTYWAMLKLDGTPVPEKPKGSGYDAFAPYGPVDVWRGTIYSYEFTLSAAQAAIAAYEVTAADGSPDAELLALARRWGSVVERALPAQSSRRWKSELEKAMPRAAETGGAYAEDYGRAISLFVHLYRATGEEHYLKLAETLATEAVTKLFHNGLFVGHPAKPYYENTNGVGLLLVALLELDAPTEDLGGAL